MMLKKYLLYISTNNLRKRIKKNELFFTFFKNNFYISDIQYFKK